MPRRRRAHEIESEARRSATPRFFIAATEAHRHAEKAGRVIAGHHVSGVHLGLLISYQCHDYQPPKRRHCICCLGTMNDFCYHDYRRSPHAAPHEDIISSPPLAGLRRRRFLARASFSLSKSRESTAPGCKSLGSAEKPNAMPISAGYRGYYLLWAISTPRRSGARLLAIESLPLHGFIVL